ncbi:MAG: NACHT domain-containing protein [Chloroflexota bacterium]
MDSIIQQLKPFYEFVRDNPLFEGAGWEVIVVTCIIIASIGGFIWRRFRGLWTEQPSHTLSAKNIEQIENDLLEIVQSDVNNRLRKERNAPALIQLDLTEQLEANGSEARQLPRNKSIYHVYFEYFLPRMLLLGEPGSGKSTMLYIFADECIKHRDKGKRIPLILNLASWGLQKKSLVEWIKDELKRLYAIQKSESQHLIEGNKLLFLLDGLDEVDAEHRQDCVDAINTFCSSTMVFMVYTSRYQDYGTLERRLDVKATVILQALDEATIDDYVQHAGPNFAKLRTVLQTRTELLELARSPLMLNIMLRTFDDSSSHLLDYKFTTQKTLFNEYIKARLSDVQNCAERYTAKETIHWLRQLTLSGYFSNFRLEDLPILWLLISAQKKSPNWVDRIGLSVSIGMAMMFILSMLGGLIGLLLSWSGKGIWVGLIFGFLTGFLLDRSYIPWLTRWVFKESRLKSELRILGEIKPFCGVRWRWKDAFSKAYPNPVYGTVLTILFFFIFVGFPSSIYRIWTTFKTAESNSAIIWHILPSLSYGIWLTVVLSVGIWILGTIYYIIEGFISGITIQRSTQKDAHSSQVIRISGRFALGFGTLGGIITGTIWGIMMSYSELSQQEILTSSVALGLMMGTILYLRFGGEFYLFHYFVRFLMYLNGYTLFRLVRFLNYSTERTFLTHSDGSYRFIHQQFMLHLMLLKDEDVAEITQGIS